MTRNRTYISEKIGLPPRGPSLARSTIECDDQLDNYRFRNYMFHSRTYLYKSRAINGLLTDPDIPDPFADLKCRRMYGFGMSGRFKHGIIDRLMDPEEYDSLRYPGPFTVHYYRGTGNGTI
jgi:hypothetical protein